MVGSRGCRLHVLKVQPWETCDCAGIRGWVEEKTGHNSALEYEQNLFIKAMGWRGGKCASHLSCFACWHQDSQVHILAPEPKGSSDDGHDGDLVQPCHSPPVVWGWATRGHLGKHGRAPGSVGPLAEGSPRALWGPPLPPPPLPLQAVMEGDLPSAAQLSSLWNGEEVAVMVHRELLK